MMPLHVVLTKSFNSSSGTFICQRMSIIWPLACWHGHRVKLSGLDLVTFTCDFSPEGGSPSLERTHGPRTDALQLGTNTTLRTVCPFPVLPVMSWFSASMFDF